MGLLEKLKNTFFEEEYIEVEENTKKESKPLARKVELKPKKEEKKAEIVELPETPKVEEVKKETTTLENYADKELLIKDHNIPYFEDEDFVEEPSPSKSKEIEPAKIYGEDPKEIYQSFNYQMEDSHKPYSNSSNKTGFKPTPIISPIYGVLDKNYRKEEVIDKKDKPSSYVSRRNADLDFVRNKAFGSLEDDIMPDSFSKKEILDDSKDIVGEENLLVDMTDTDTTPSVEKVTIADAEEYFEDLGLEYNIDYKDSHYEKATGRRSKVSAPLEEEIKEQSSEEENVVSEDNLFDLIDSMYEDKE